MSHAQAQPHQQCDHTQMNTNVSFEIQVQTHSTKWESTRQMWIDVKNETGRSYGVELVGRILFGAAVLAPTIWRRLFGARLFWRRAVLAPV